MGRRSGENDFMYLCAFIGIVIAALGYATAGILQWIPGVNGTLIHIIKLVGEIAILIAVAICAWRFVAYRSKGWKIFYFIILAIYIFGVIFGVLPVFGIVRVK